MLGGDKGKANRGGKLSGRRKGRSSLKREEEN